MEDPDEKAAFLFELFPEESLASIYSTLLNNNCDIDESIKSILDKDNPLSEPDQDSKDESVFDQLINGFPDVEIEAIEAFLSTQDESADLETILKEFTKQTSAPVSPSFKSTRDRNLKMKLSDFTAVLKTSSEENLENRLKTNSRGRGRGSDNEAFIFTFLEEGDFDFDFDFDFDEYEGALTNASGFKVREMATELREERIEKLRRAGEYFKSGSLTGKLSASHFSDEGQAMTPKVARLNRIAADKIFKERNEHFKYSNTIDLHYLTVSESQLVAKAFLKHHEGLRTGSIQIITGRGNHSNGGICKLSASILNILKGQNRKYSFDGIATFTIKLY